MTEAQATSQTTWRSRAGSWAAAGAGAVPLVLAIIAEAAWIAVVANVINEYFLRHPVLEIPAFMAFVAVGFIASRRIAPSVGSRWPAFVLIATIAAALVGVLWAPAARDALALPFPQGLTEMLGANPGGLLAGLAFIRGVAWGHAGLPLPEDKLVRLLSGGLIVVALAAVAGAPGHRALAHAVPGQRFGGWPGLWRRGPPGPRFYAAGHCRRRRGGRLAAQPGVGDNATGGHRHDGGDVRCRFGSGQAHA